MPKVSKSPKTTRQQGPLLKKDANTSKKPAASKSTRKDSSQTRSKAASPKQSKAQPAKKTTASSKNGPKAQAKQRTDRTNYVLYARLRNSSDPTITRLLSVPSDLTFWNLHMVMQVAFGWASCHSFAFNVEELPSMEEVDAREPYRRAYPKVVLSINTNPEIFNGMTNMPPAKDVRDVTLQDIYDEEQYKGKVSITYEYDMGDSWEHDIVFLGNELPSVRQQLMVPSFLPVVCLGGEGHPCAEDCGSTPGWEYLKELFAKPRSRDPDGLRDWYKNHCLNGDKKGLDPYTWNIFEVNHRLEHLAKDKDF